MLLSPLVLLTASLTPAWAGEADLIVPNLSSVSFLGIDGKTLLLYGMTICVFGFLFGLVQFVSIMKMPVHKAMKDISELIYETCKTYLITQGKFLLILELLVGIVMIAYFGWLRHMEFAKVVMILICSLIGIAGSYGVAWFGMRINTMANSRSAFASLAGSPYPVYSIPIQAGMSIGMLLISTELLVMLCILLFIDPSYAGPCFIGFAIGESLGASVLRIAGGIFTKIADIGSDLMKIVFNIKKMTHVIPVSSRIVPATTRAIPSARQPMVLKLTALQVWRSFPLSSWPSRTRWCRFSSWSGSLSCVF